MREDNFIYFFTIIGFFIGIIMGILNTSDSFNMLFYTLAITGFFYLFIHVIISLYIDIKNPILAIFNKQSYEKECDIIISELEHREHKLRASLEFIYEKHENAKN